LQVRELREIVQKHNLENRDGADINGVTAPEAQLLRLGELVETMNNIHSRALRMEGGTAAGLVSASVERCVRSARPESCTVASAGVLPARYQLDAGRRECLPQHQVVHLFVSFQRSLQARCSRAAAQ
jgi:hypothetical protein